MKAPLLILLVVFLIVRRVWRSVGFQPYREQTLAMRILLFGVFAATILYGAILFPGQLIPDSIGIVVGLVLAYIATRHAQFEKRDNVLYFKTHIWLEIIVVSLFIIRFVYRVYMHRDAFNNGPAQEMQARIDYFRDPFTGCIFLAFCFYYIGYYSFVLREGRKQITG